jgi:valyl-tRNA synthetase
MNKEAGPYLGMDRFECRDVIVADLERLGLLESTEDYHHSIGRCDRCDTIVEPIVSEQWFVRMEPLARPAIKAVEEGRVEIIPHRFARVYMNWMENIRDWCISRQLWWGHRIPVWYCGRCGEITVAIDDPSSCEKCGSDDLQQDPDVLDTWFSSALWPHSTLGWPRETEELRYFYPTSVLETGYDILFFWVARMIMTGLYNMKDVPFRHVYLHGLIRDAKGRKMTKSLGNVVDPIQAIDRYGCDALRFVLATGGAPGNDFRLSDDKLEGGRNFANKIWNASRFVIMNLAEHGPVDKPLIAEDSPAEDRWILGLAHVITGGIESITSYEQGRGVPSFKGVSQLLEEFQLGEAAQRVHGFFWHSFCDWYIETAKLRLRRGDLSPLPIMASVLDISLRLLHPFMPFVTEAVWQLLRPYLKWADAEALIVAPWPRKHHQMETVFLSSREEVSIIQEVVQAIRECRTVGQVPPSARLPSVIIELAPAIRSAQLMTEGTESRLDSERDDVARALVQSYAELPERARETIVKNGQVIQELARVAEIKIVDRLEGEVNTEEFIPQNAGSVNVYVPTEGLVDIDEVRARLSKQQSEAEGEVKRLEGKLANVQFRDKAPEAVVAKEEEKLAAARARLDGLRERLAELG